MGNCASIALFLCGRIPMRQFRYYCNNMYTVINIITIIKHQLRCVGQVFSYFSFIVWVHVISPFKSYPIKFGTTAVVCTSQASRQARRQYLCGVSYQVLWYVLLSCSTLRKGLPSPLGNILNYISTSETVPSLDSTTINNVKS